MRSVAGFLLLALVGCGGGDRGSASASGAAATTPTPRVEPARPTAGAASRRGVDPEPPGAQALAEEVLGAEWNRDKKIGLEMQITTLVDARSGLEGYASQVTAREVPIEDRLSALGAEVGATEVTIRLPGSILFDFDSATLRADAERTLAEVAAILRAYASRPVRVEGHTDAIASEAYNLELSRRRAEAVSAWLVAHGVAPGRLKSAGWGESKPVADNATPAGRQSNRRVELIIERGAS